MAIFRKSYDYYLGYALGGGGAKGFAHLGALKALESKGLKPDIVAGTSAGALAGAFYADGYAPDEIAELFQDKVFREFVGITLPKVGFFKTAGLLKFIKKNLRAKSFEQLQIPFVAVATDWKKARAVPFSQGKELAEAVVASCSIPIIFYPQYIDEVPYVDGGLFKNLPVSIIRQECKYVIGINVVPIMPATDKPNIKNIAERTFKLMSISNTIIDRHLSDVLIEAEGTEKYTMFDLDNIEQISEIGYSCASDVINDPKHQHLVRRCLRHEQLEKMVQQKLNRKK